MCLHVCVCVYFSVLKCLSMNLFFPGMVLSTHSVPLAGTPVFPFCFLWTISLKFTGKCHRTIFPLQIRARHEEVGGLT